MIEVRRDTDTVHMRQVDHETPVANCVACHIVPTAPDGNWKTMLTAIVHASCHITSIATPGDERRMTIDHGIPDPPRGIVVRSGRLQQVTAKSRTQSVEIGRSITSRVEWHFFLLQLSGS